MGTRDAGGLSEWQAGYHGDGLASERTKSTRTHTYAHTLTIQPNRIATRELRAAKRTVLGWAGVSKPAAIAFPSSPSPPLPSRYIQSINQSINQSCTEVAGAINECLAEHARQQSTRGGKYHADQPRTSRRTQASHTIYDTIYAMLHVHAEKRRVSYHQLAYEIDTELTNN